MTASKKLKYSLSVKKYRIEYAESFKRQLRECSLHFPSTLKSLAFKKKSEKKREYQASALKKVRFTAAKAYERQVNILINVLAIRAALLMRNSHRFSHKKTKQPSGDSKEDAPDCQPNTTHLISLYTSSIFYNSFKYQNFTIINTQIMHKIFNLNIIRIKVLCFLFVQMFLKMLRSRAILQINF
jgi:hypothetical protein